MQPEQLLELKRMVLSMGGKTRAFLIIEVEHDGNKKLLWGQSGGGVDELAIITKYADSFCDREFDRLRVWGGTQPVSPTPILSILPPEMPAPPPMNAEDPTKPAGDDPE